MAISSKIKLDGEAEYKRAVSNINSQLKLLDAQIEKVSTSFDLNTNSQDNNTKRQELLKKKIDLLTQVQEEHLNILQKSNKLYGEGSTKSNDYATKMIKTSNNVDKLEKEIEDLNKDLNEENTNLTKSEKSWNGVNAVVTTFGDKIKTAFASRIVNGALDTIQNGINKIKDTLIEAGKSAFDFYAQFEQGYNGIEGIFKNEVNSTELVNKVLATSENAWKKMGISQVEYASQFTSTYALVKSDIEDANEAMKVTNDLLTIQSDLANTFGYDISVAENALNWMLKDTYNYVDNLGLGIQGTKEGFLAAAKEAGFLVDNVNELTQSQKLEVIQYFADKVGALGKTSESASTTIKGSTAQMKASWDNLLLSLASGNNVDVNLQNLFESAKIALENYMPIVQNIFNGFIEMIPNAIGTLLSNIPTILLNIIPTIADAFNNIIDTFVNNKEAIVNGSKAIGNIFMNMFSSLRSKVPEITAFITELVIETIEFISQNISSIVDGLVNVMISIANSIIDELPDLIESLVDMLINTIVSLLNNVDRIVSAGLDIINALVKGIMGAIPTLLSKIPEIIGVLVRGLINSIGEIIVVGQDIIMNLVEGLVVAIPELIAMIPMIIIEIVNALLDAIPTLIEVGTTIPFRLIEGIFNTLPQLIAKAPEIMSRLVEAIFNTFDKIVEIGKNIIPNLINGLVTGFANLYNKGKEAITNMINGITSNFQSILSIGKEIVNKFISGVNNMISGVVDIGKKIVTAIWDGISSGFSWLGNKFSEFGSWCLNGLKGVFGIHSPSTKFRDEIGFNLAAGVGEGFINQMINEQKRMQTAIPQQFGTSLLTKVSVKEEEESTNRFVTAVNTALKATKVVLNDREVGEFAINAVGKAIYG